MQNNTLASLIKCLTSETTPQHFPRVNRDIWVLILPIWIFSPDDSSPAPHHWTGRSASSWSFSPLQFCRSCVRPGPSSDRSFFCGFPSGAPSDVPEPPCVWKKTGMPPCLCPPTRYFPSYRHLLKDPTGTGINESSFYCLFKNIRELHCY